MNLVYEPLRPQPLAALRKNREQSIDLHLSLSLIFEHLKNPRSPTNLLPPLHHLHPQIDALLNESRSSDQTNQRRLVFDGLYTWTEYKALKHEFPGELTVVAVVAPKHIRHHRLTQRPIRPLTIEEANHRDWAEIENIEKGGPIAIADYYIDNSGDRNTLHREIDDILKRVEF